jgi:DNA-directed RNA polymerase specialized sigma24 family protein
MVFLESLRQEERDRRIRDHASLVTRVEADVSTEARFQCLEHGLASLDADGRDLILGYYSDTGDGKIEQRKRLAESLGISLTALRIRAHRLRERLSSIVMGCLEAQAG